MNYHAERTSEKFGSVLVEFEHIGEGYFGDYEPDNPEDAPLYRVDVMTGDDNAGYCTGIVMDLPDVDYQALVEQAADAACWLIERGLSCKAAAAHISWWSVEYQCGPLRNTPFDVHPPAEES